MGSTTKKDQWITVAEAARIADVSDRWMRELARSGKVKAMPFGRGFAISRWSAEAFERTPNEGRPRKSAKRRRKPAK